MIAEHWINRGYKANQVLKIIGISSSTYYAFQKRQNCPQKLPRKSSGRPIKGYSMSAVGKKISDEQIKEYLSELIVGEECSYGYRKLTHYNSLTERFDTAKGELEKIGQSILEKQAQREMMKKFITEVKAMPDIISIFDEDSWCALVDYVTINSTTDVVFTMKNGLEIRI